MILTVDCSNLSSDDLRYRLNEVHRFQKSAMCGIVV